MKPKRAGLFLVGAVPTALSVLCLSASVTLALANPCYWPHNGAKGVEDEQPSSKGVQTTADLVSGTPVNPNTTAIVHPATIVPAGSTDFVGWGTAKGLGVDDCPTYTGTRWQVYVDGLAFGVYFCRQAYGSEPDTASNQRIEIKHTSCNGSTRWAFYWNGTLKTCQLIDGVSGMPSVGGESIGADPQHIDIHYKLLKYRVFGGTWTAWTSADFCPSFNDPYYIINYVGFADIYPQER